ncbi:hypothetical protein ACWD6I_26850 [Streptomyces sp. NPDC002454]
MVSTWAPGITPEWMSKEMGLPLPPTARSPKAAYETTIQFDTGVLTFTLTRSEAETYLKENPPKGEWSEPNETTNAALDDFTRLGVPEPGTLTDGVREGHVCPSRDAPGSAKASPGASNDPFASSGDRCVTLYAHAYSPERTRIYLRAHYEPGISPLPVAPSSTD